MEGEGSQLTRLAEEIVAAQERRGQEQKEAEAASLAELREERRLRRLAAHRPRIVEGVRTTNTR